MKQTDLTLLAVRLSSLTIRHIKLESLTCINAASVFEPGGTIEYGGIAGCARTC